MNLNLNDIKSLDINDVGAWPTYAKGITITVIFSMVLAAGFWLDTRHQIQVLETTINKEQELKTTFETKQRKAANLDAYINQMDEMKQSFGTMLRQLPGKTEVAELLVDISQAGLANGLEFDLFRPEQEKPEEFYSELPIQLRVTGNYHDFGHFISDISVLPRIVTLHNFMIEPNTSKKNPGLLVMEATAKTYRYLEEGQPE